MRRVALGVLFAAGLLSCAQASSLRGRIHATDQVLQQAEHNGAYQCAPRELAEGRAHNRFASQELDEGNLNRAQEEFVQAETNANAALRLSPPERCAPRNVVVERPGDRDGDGILDP